jgi:murein DD-endopeptidase MepM/ murein hydrolase activator NlpD
MKKNIYYYSQKKLKYVEINNFYTKFISILALFSTVFALIFLGSYLFISNLINPKSDLSEMRKENKKLKEKYVGMSSQINQLYADIQYLTDKEDELRLSVNLDPLSDEEKNFGIGGAAFDNMNLSTIADVKDIVGEVDNSLDVLKSKVIFAKDNYKKIEESLNQNLALFEALPALLPTQGRIGDKFGMRKHPILKIQRMHTGIDIVVNTGNIVYAAGKGKVVRASYNGGYGKTVEIDHGFGYTTLYAHLSKINVKKGQNVKRGEEIGLSGETGRLATGPHLHYEVKHNGVHLNPKNFIFSDIKAFDSQSEKASF